MPVKTESQPAARHTFFLVKKIKRSWHIKSQTSTQVSSIAELRNSMAHATKDSLWISYEKHLTESFLKLITWPTRSLGDAVLVHPMPPQTLPTLASCFKRLAFSVNGKFLPLNELAEALQAPNRSDLFIGGAVDHTSQAITLWRGNLEAMTVPFSAFEKSADGIAPDFADFSIADYGQSIRLGDYEAAGDAVLYEFDPEYRRRISKERRQSEQSFGASLRRLRKQRGLRREDFGPGIAAKTIARIEQGKVRRIQSKTLAALAEKLKVKPMEIATY
jgi:DNA-binding Xre family transcriptional regulator